MTVRRFAALILLFVAGTSPPAAGARAQPAVTTTLPLVAGWNNVAYLGPTAPVTQVLASVSGSYATVWEFDPPSQSFKAFDPSAPMASDLVQLTSQRACWIYMHRASTLTMTVAQPSSTTITLFPGLNNIAYVGLEAPLAEVLAPVAGYVPGVWRWDAPTQRWQGGVPGVPHVSEFTVMTPGRAYSIQFSAAMPATFRGPEVARPSPGPTARVCYSFASRQPELTELRTAFNRAGFGQLVTEPSFALPSLETQPDGDGNPVPGYLPPTLLKAIAWTESSWRHAGYEIPRGTTGRTLTSSSCAFGIMQILTSMEILERPTARQEQIGADYRFNIAAGARILAEKWNLGPSPLPVIRPRNPQVLEDWYYAVWAYHCFGERCTQLGLHDNPDDPALTWPRPAYNSPEQLASRGRFTRADYPYQELVYGLIQHPPRADGVPIWSSLPVKLPPPGAVTHPTPKSIDGPGVTTDPTRPGDP